MLKRSDFEILPSGTDKTLLELWLKIDSKDFMVYSNNNISEIERFIDYKIRESLKYQESASDYFVLLHFSNEKETKTLLTLREPLTLIIDLINNFKIINKDQFQEWLEFHGINIELEAKQ